METTPTIDTYFVDTILDKKNNKQDKFALIAVYWNLEKESSIKEVLWDSEFVKNDYIHFNKMSWTWLPLIDIDLTEMSKKMIEVALYKVDRFTARNLDELKWHPFRYKREKVLTESWIPCEVYSIANKKMIDTSNDYFIETDDVFDKEYYSWNIITNMKKIKTIFDKSDLLTVIDEEFDVLDKLKNWNITKKQVLNLTNNINNIKNDWKDIVDILDEWEFRIIPEHLIEKIFYNEQKEQIEEVYLEDLPWFIANYINWDWVIEACKADGYWHFFNRYDGGLIESYSNHPGEWYYLFRQD